MNREIREDFLACLFVAFVRIIKCGHRICNSKVTASSVFLLQSNIYYRLFGCFDENNKARIWTF